MKRFVILVVILTCAGCGVKTPKLYKPGSPAVLADNYLVADYQADKKAYEAAVRAGDRATAKTVRNKMIWSLTWTIDTAFEEYSQGIGALRATAGVTSEMVQSALSGATTITNGQRLKDILGVTLLGTQNFERSIKGHFFGNVPPETLIGAMKASRAPIEAAIQKGLALDVDQYPFEQARADLGRLYYAGTLESALEYLAQAAQAGK